MLQHKVYLLSTCRICGERSQTRRGIREKKKRKYVKGHKDNVYMLYGIDISDHQAGTRPDKICPTCYQRLMSSKNTGKDGKMNLSGMYAKQKDIVQGIASMWKEHDDNDCKICTHYEEQCQPLRKTHT